ncbi:MAG: serine hydrolase [Sphingomonadaceae bacterium]|nr:serine hydrolase [Sphingomonadaceae bacterium]
MLLPLPLLAAAALPLAQLEDDIDDSDDVEAAEEAAEASGDFVLNSDPDLDPLLEELFTSEGIGETRAVLVVRDGELVAERYAPGYTAEQRFISWSMAKTITAMLIGELVGDGRLDLDAPAPIPEWQGADDPRREITLRHLLHMSSGLDHTEVNDPIWDSDTNRMLFTSAADDMAGYAVARELEAEPGEKYEYSSATTVILSRIIADRLTNSSDPGARAAAYNRFAQQRLFGPALTPSFFLEFDAQGTQIGGSLIHATARDWARMGEVLRTGSSVDGTQIISPEWLAFMTTPSPNNSEYGGQTWLNRPGGNNDNPVLFPDRAPQTLYSMIGHLGQYVMVSPDQGLTVVRLGNTPDGDLREAMVLRLARFFEG